MASTTFSAMLFVSTLTCVIPAGAACDQPSRAKGAKNGAREAIYFPDSALRAVVVVGHGLNNPPSLMQELAMDLCRRGDLTLLMQLKGHDPEFPDTAIRSVTPADWIQEAEATFIRATELAAQRKVPLRFIGYSLSALVVEAAANLNPQAFAAVERVVYLAPAIGVKPYAHLVRLLPMSGSYIISSRNRADSRVNAGTSLAAYRALFALRSRLFETRFANFTVPHLAFLYRGDELVDQTNTRKLVKEYGLTHWRVVEIEKNAEGKRHSHNHLGVNRASLGAPVYDSVLNSIEAFFAEPAAKAKAWSR